MSPSGAAVGLPGYAFNVRLHNYVRLDTGRMVKRSAINELLTSVTDGAGDRLAKLAQAAQRGELTGRQFYELAQREIKHATNAAASLGKGGWDRMTQADWGANGAQLRREYGFLRDFAAELAEGKVSELQAGTRGKLYADSAYKRFWELDRQAAMGRGIREARLVTAGDDRVCPICTAEASRGWQPVDSVPLAGTLHGNCRCENEYR